jgi:ribose 5-phosphate isomerase A
MHDADALKRQAAALAVEQVESGMVLGLGTGSTVDHFLDLLGLRLSRGELSDVVGVPSSVRSEQRARRLGIPLVGLGERNGLDLAVDGADEVSLDLDLIKGMGGALLREKMVAQAAHRFVVIADASKKVERLGTASPLPVEVVEWEWRVQAAFLAERGAQVTLRTLEGGLAFRSDNGNVILHCRFPAGIDDPHALDASLKSRAGVVETGLFLDLATEAILAGPEGIEVLRRKP